MTVNKLRDFIFQNYYKRILFVQEKSYYSMKQLKKKFFLLLVTNLIEKIANTGNSKEYYNPYL